LARSTLRCSVFPDLIHRFSSSVSSGLSSILAATRLIQGFDYISLIFAIIYNDAAAVAANFTEDGIWVVDTGPLYGRQAIEKQVAEWFKGARSSNHMDKRDPNTPRIVGTADKIASNGDWSGTYEPPNGKPFQLKGYWANIVVREGDAWKIWMSASMVSPAPAATTTTGSQ
jgi:uncharacterized protein (TIGR02246 family)